MKELVEMIERHPGMQYYRALMRHKFSQNILASNTTSLRNYLAFLESDNFVEKSDRLEAHQQWFELDQRLLTKLHNFAAGASTLVDHTRVLMNSPFIRSSHRDRYQARVDATFDVPIARFVKKLRNYIVHCGPPKTAKITKINPSEVPDMVSIIVLDWEDMRNWEGWDVQTRLFMDGRQPDIHILPLIEEYLTLVAAFHTWFVDDFWSEYSSELAELKCLQMEWNMKIGFPPDPNR